MADSITRKNYRVMAEQPISHTFKGILRVANVLEADTEKGEDKFFNSAYYGIPEGYISSQNVGYASAGPALDGQLNRYTFIGDSYKNKKIPVTDSLGHYVNLNVGQDGTTIGSDESNNGNDVSIESFTQIINNITFNQDKIFPVVEAPDITIGLESKEHPNSKVRVISGQLNIDSSPTNPSLTPQIIVSNKFDHTAKNIDNNGNYIEINDPNLKYRTIYKITNKTPSDGDMLVHYQDNIDYDNLKLGTLDAFVDSVNLKEYVRERINKWLGNNSGNNSNNGDNGSGGGSSGGGGGGLQDIIDSMNDVFGNNCIEVPTGQVIWQYIDLNKWYCIGNNSYTGHNPPMGNNTDNRKYTNTKYQGVVKKNINHLLEESGTNELNEIIPLYKRDYTLCDGTAYKIHLLPYSEKDSNIDYQSYDRFMDLFFAIGYYYTDLGNIRPFYKNQIDPNRPNDSVYRYVYKSINKDTGLEEGYEQDKSITDKDTLFEVHLATIFAFTALQTELRRENSAILDDNGRYNRAKAEEWLKKQNIPAEYIFNTMIPEVNGGMIYHYNMPASAQSSNIYPIRIGSEVNSFNSKIHYYDSTKAEYIVCKVWQTAEVQSVLTLFSYDPIQYTTICKRELLFTFQVPNFNIDTQKYNVGAFIGSSPYFWSNNGDTESVSYSYCQFSNASLPHRHFIAWGPSKLEDYPTLVKIKPYLIPGWQILSGPTENIPLSQSSMVRAEAAYHFMHALPSENVKTDNVDSYEFAEVAGLYYEKEMHANIPIYVIQRKNQKNPNISITYPEHTDPRWTNAEPYRGITSPPIETTIIDPKYEYVKANSMNNKAEYFLPECVQMIPLIKL